MQNTQAAKDHLKTHQTYPATKAQLVEACNNLSDFSAEDKQEFSSKLPEGTYNSAEEVMKALGMDMGTDGGSMPSPDGETPPGTGTPPPADGGMPGGGQMPPSGGTPPPTGM